MTPDTKPAVPSQAIEKKNNDPAAAAEQPAPSSTQEYLPKAALEKLEKPELVQLAAYFSSKTTVGPDPETAKLMAQTEMHHESCRLEAYKKNLENQEEDSKRKHQFRTKRLNHQTFLLTAVLIGALGGAGVGLYLTIMEKPVGSNILIASIATIVYVITGKTPFHQKED